MAGGTVGGRHAAGRVRLSNVPLVGFGPETETFGDGWKSVKEKIDFQMPLFFSFKLIKSTQKLIHDDMSTNNNSYQLGSELQSCHI